MRVKRTYKFQKLRRRKVKKILMYGFLLPSILIMAGYLISLLFIIPLLNN